jgi:processive 1,2-diacylglycerol beta-glucosyltransferase
LDRREIIDSLGFDISKPILLIVGGRISYRNLLAIVDGVKEKNKSLQIIIVAGRDKVLQKKLRYLRISKDPSVRIFDFIDNLDEFMAAADLILTKAGGLTVSECLVKSLPMVINDIILGQEEDNVDYAVKHNVGRKADNIKETIEIINELFLQPEKLTAMKENCKKISKPHAVIDLVDFVVSKLDQKHF